MRHCLLVVAALFGAVGCGDNSKVCGTGTIEKAGECIADGTPPTCTDGTVLDVESNSCVIDPNACQDGTVLVGGACVDPGHITADLEEGAEPNGLAIGEASVDGAGDIVLRPIGETFVIHGKLVPFQDADGDGQTDPDVDTYRITITAPTLIEVSADGLHGMVGGFLAVAAVDAGDPMFDWGRLGVAVSGDVAKRRLYLPVPGTYALAIADSRTLLADAAAGKDASDPDALDFEYYVSISQQTVTATTLTTSAGLATASGMLSIGEVTLFTVQMGLGANTVSLDIPSEATDGSLVIANARGANVVAKSVDDEGPNGRAATPPLVGFLAGDTTTVVVDHVISSANQPVAFELIVTTTGAGALVGGDRVNAVTANSSNKPTPQ